MPTIISTVKKYAVEHSTLGFSGGAELVLGGSGAADPASARHELEQGVVKHVGATSYYAKTGMIRAASTATKEAAEPFKKLRELEFDWDGHSSDPPSEALILTAEGFWAILQELKVQEIPVVKAGADGLIAFSWLQHYPDPHMEISIYEIEDGYFTCDWYVKKAGVENSGESKYPCSALRSVVQAFFST